MMGIKYAFGIRSQNELRMNYSCLCVPMNRTQWRVGVGSRFSWPKLFQASRIVLTQCSVMHMRVQQSML